MVTKKTYYITTTIPYANAPPHIGFAMEITQADILSRWHRLMEEDVFLLTGTDEHGSKIYKTAEEKGLSPIKFVNEISNQFRELTKTLNISNNNFIRTTDQKAHWPGVIEIWNLLVKNGDIYKKRYEGFYCQGCERFVTEKDLINNCCPDHPNLKIEKISEENYFFKLSRYSKRITDAIKEYELEIFPEKYKNDFLSLIKDGLTDVSFSRDKKHLPWGIPVPGDANQVMYVWCDALVNYLTGIGYPDKKYKKYWPAEVHVVGKDMLRFHTGIWPGMLLAAGLELPKKVIVHGFLTVDGKKMSKSLGNVINPLDLKEKYLADSIRYYLARAVPFGEDGDFSESALVDRHNNELADKLGNLVSRVSTLAENYGIEKKEQAKELNSEKLVKIVKDNIDNFAFDKALNEIFAHIDKCNTYIQDTSPWVTKDKKVLYQLSQAIRDITILLSPFTPETCEKIAKTFNFDIDIKNLGKPLKVSKIKKSEVLFKKIDVTKKEEDKSKAIKSEKSQKIEGVMNMNQIKYEDFAKLDLRVGTIKKIEDVEGADKLLKLEVDIGSGVRTILAGIKAYYSKEELKDKQIIVISNLEPRKMKGIESQGMLLAASSPDGSKVILLSPEKKIDSGSKVQ